MGRIGVLGVWRVAAVVVAFLLGLSGTASARPGHVSHATTEQLAGFRVHRIVYTSTGLAGEPIAVTGTIVVPDGPAPAGGRPIVAWAHPTTGVAPRCAPSLMPNQLGKIPGLAQMLAQGWIVAETDYPGLGTTQPHPYLVGVSEARAVLDSVRAARDLLGPEAGRRFVVWGHSQGGHAALFTGQLARGYAPELELAGVAAAAPASELAALFSTDLGSIEGKVLTSYTLWSWSRVYGIDLSRVAGPQQIADVDRIAGVCLGDIESELDLFLLAQPLQQSFLKVADLTEVAPWRGLIARNTPTGAGIRVPIFLAQGLADTLVKPAVTEDFLGRLCRAGKLVAFYPAPGISHGKIARFTASATVAWMADRFAGAPAPTSCRG